MQRNGFTLVELMVVIALMAVAAGAVVVTVGSSGGGADAAASRFASRVAAARDEAVLSGRPVSVWVAASGYGFDRHREGRWEPMEAKPLDTADWGKDVTAQVAGGGEARSRIRFDSLGMADRAATVRLSQDGRTLTVAVAPNGDVTVG